MDPPKTTRTSSSPLICSLSAKDAFDKLTLEQKLYAHHMARASWHGTRIILRQVSPESVKIFEFILELHRACGGDWERFRAVKQISPCDLLRFLEYAATFLSNIGNYWGHGDQKFIPEVEINVMRQLSSVSTLASTLYSEVEKGLMVREPNVLGYPSETSQSSYYPGTVPISNGEMVSVTQLLDAVAVDSENTRICKIVRESGISYHVLQASVQNDDHIPDIGMVGTSSVRVVRGDHKEELSCICEALEQAQKHTANSLQKQYIAELHHSFTTGDMRAYRKSQEYWVKDVQPAVETVLGFVEPYRDPFGVRAEFEGVVALVDEGETDLLKNLAHTASKFVRRLPWAGSMPENDWKGPFEREVMDTPDFTSLHTIAYCSSIIFPGINLPNYNDIRQDIGFKNVMITNSMMNDSYKDESIAFCLNECEREQYLEHRRHAFYLWVVFHELFGHGTGKLLTEREDGSFNFDIKNPPINPLTGKPISSWYHRDQTWTGLFGDIATSVDECRAECVGADLLSDKDLLALCGYTDDTEINCGDLEYNMYLQLGVAGLRSLENYHPTSHKWGQAHSRGHFAIFRTLLEAKGHFMKVQHDTQAGTLRLSIDRSKIATHGRPALRDLLLRLHIYRCTADAKNCRSFYEDLTEPGPVFLEWREVVLRNPIRKKVFVQPNTSIVDGDVVLKEYEQTVEGVIQSWAERNV